MIRDVDTTRGAQSPGVTPLSLRVQPSPALDLIDALPSTTRRTVRVAIVARDAHVRLALAQEFAADRRVELVGQAGTLREGRGLGVRNDLDVLLVDLTLPDGDGLALLSQWTRVRPDGRAIAMASSFTDDQALTAFRAGAAACLVRQQWLGSFAQAVVHVAQGGAVLTPELARRLCTMPRLPEAEPAGASGLSGRERQILSLAASGLRSREIAQRLAISSDTVSAHLKNVYRKLQVHSRTHAVRVASQIGLL